MLFLNNFEEIQFTYKHVTHPSKMLSYLSISCLSNSVVLVLFTELHNHHHCLILDHFHHCIKQKETRYPFAVTPQPLPSNHQPTFCLFEFAHNRHPTSMDSYSICPIVSGFFYITFSMCVHVVKDSGTVSPLHVKEFHSESPFVSPVFHKSNKLAWVPDQHNWLYKVLYCCSFIILFTQMEH